MCVQDCTRNLISAVHRAAPGHQLALAGVLSDRVACASPLLQSDRRDFQHDVSIRHTVQALRDAYERGRSAFSEHIRSDPSMVGNTDASDPRDHEDFADNTGSVLPSSLTLSLSDTRFGTMNGRRKASYAASWSYVPVVWREGERVPLRCMDVAELERGFMWFTRANRRGRRRDPEWDPVWTDVGDDDDEPMDFGWAPLPADRDFIVRLVRTEGITQCQNTWTAMGTMAHRRLRAYDILTDADFINPANVYQVRGESEGEGGAAGEDVYMDVMHGRRWQRSPCLLFAYSLYLPLALCLPPMYVSMRL